MEDELPGPGRNVIMHPLYLPKMSSWLDLKVFYVRVSNCKVDESSPDHLTLNHIPLTPDTVLEVNGRRSSICVSSLLRRDRVDKRSEEVTYVSTDSISITGSIIFEVCDRDDLLLSGVLELSDDNGVIGEQRSSSSKRWKMECHSLMSGGSTCFLKDKLYMSSETILPTVEVYVAGCFSGIPIIMTKTLKLGIQKKQQRTVVLDSIPEYETAEHKKQVSPKYTSQRENSGCKYIEWMQQAKASKTKKKLVDDGATTSSRQDKGIMKEILLEVEIEHRVAQRQVEMYGSILKKFRRFKIE